MALKKGASAKKILENSRKAFASWKKTTPAERARKLARIREAILEDIDLIVEEIVKNTGKADTDALMSDVLPTLEMIQYYEKNAARILAREKRKTPLMFINNSSFVEYKPLGVVLVISPWNYPFQLSLVPAITALAAGNTVILKPSSATSFIGRTLERTMRRAGLPKNVFQVFRGNGRKAQELIKAGPDLVFFTGSTGTGKKVMRTASENLVPVELELGGKDPMIVFEDADLERAADAAVYGAFANAGQTCVSIERLYVQESVMEEFLGKLLEKTRGIRVGSGSDCDVGAMITKEQLMIVEEHIDDALAKGARLLTKRKKKGLFLYPQVLSNVNHGMKVMKQETFGPVLPVMAFKTEKQAVELANDSDYGLNSSVWTKDIKKAERVVRALETGNAYINDAVKNIGNPHLPFGGAKKSGIGAYHGPEGLRRMSQACSVMVSKGKGKEPNWFPYTTGLYQTVKKLAQTNYGNLNLIEKTRNYLSLYKKIKR